SIPTITLPGWNWNFVSTDPSGAPYPFVGVRFWTTGPGITTSDFFTVRLAMSGHASPLYDAFLVSSAGESFKMRIKPDAAMIPALSTAGLILISSLILIVGAIVVSRR